MDGGFEAARLAILESLACLGGSVAVVRQIGEDYYLSVGNWQIRETVRRIRLLPLDEDYFKYVEALGAAPGLLGGYKSLLDF